MYIIMDPINSSSIPALSLFLVDDESNDKKDKDGYGTIDLQDDFADLVQSSIWLVGERDDPDVDVSNNPETINSREDYALNNGIPHDELQPTPIGGNFHVVKDGVVPFSISVLSHCSSFVAVLQAVNDSGMSMPTQPIESSSQIHNISMNQKPVSRRPLEQDDSSCSSTSEISETSSACSRSSSPSISDDHVGHSMHWNCRFQELVAFRNVHGHCNVPYRFRQPLSEWVKRQRHQYKLKMEGKHSNLTDGRQAMLERLGFVWDSRESNWNERYQELYEFYRTYGHVRIPQKSPARRALSIWLKRQRRACRAFLAGKKYAVVMTQERMSKLKELGVKVN